MFRTTTDKRPSAASRILTAVTASVLFLVAPTVGADAFYEPPASLEGLQPGDLIRTRASSAGPPDTRLMANAWQIMYRSTDAEGKPNVVTGKVLVPKEGDPESKPIIALNPGTAGPAFRCAPSRMANKGAYYEQPAVNDMLERGYAVVITDYEGYKPDPETTYIIGESMGAAVLDGVRAAQRLAEAGLSPTAKVIFRGYSQGGGATMWAAQMQPSYAPELNLVAVAGGGVPANLALVALPLEGTDGFGVMFYAFLGLSRAYEELELLPYTNDFGKEVLEKMDDNSCILGLLQDYAGLKLEDVTDTNPLDSQWFVRIDENRLGWEPVNVPVFQYHEVQDGLVDFDQAKTLRDTYCSMGVNHTWKTFDTQGANGVIRHVNLVYQGNEAVNDFIEARLAGEPATSNCDL